MPRHPSSILPTHHRTPVSSREVLRPPSHPSIPSAATPVGVSSDPTVIPSTAPSAPSSVTPSITPSVISSTSHPAAPSGTAPLSVALSGPPSPAPSAPRLAATPTLNSALPSGNPSVAELAPPATSASTHSSTLRSSQIASESNVPATPAGYPKLAEQMGQMPETAIFRRFGFLNAQNLLYMQAELVILEKHLRRVQAEDAESGSEVRSQYAEDWFYLSTATNDEGGNDEQWELMKEIRGKLREYNDTLLQQIKLAAVEPPGTFDMQYLQQYLESREMSDGILSGADRTLWGSIDKPDDRAKDLLSLLCRHSEDFFSKWVTEKVVTKLIKLRYGSESSRERDLRNYKDNKVLRWTFLFASVLASALPVVSIAILYCVHSLKARLGLIATFNVLLSFVLATFTSAKRAEVFAVAAAFAAVQVVFVQVGTEDTK